MKELRYATVNRVTELWDEARLTDPQFDVNFGMNALDRVFELQPKARELFGFDPSTPLSSDKSDDMDSNPHKRVQFHAKSLLGLFDSILQMICTDVDFLEGVLDNLGRQHRSMGVPPSYFAYMGQGIQHSLEVSMQRPFNDMEKHAWFEIFEEINGQLLKAALVKLDEQVEI